MQLARVARRHQALVVASSDMSHYLPAAAVRERTAWRSTGCWPSTPAASTRWCHARASRCADTFRRRSCWSPPSSGGAEAELVRYATSGDATGDDRSVVGYAGVVVS